MSDDNLTGEGVLDRPKTASRRPKPRSRAQWESRVKCELLHTGRPPSFDILALCRTEPSGESRVNSHHVGFGRFGDGVMATSLGTPNPDCNARGTRARERRAALEALALHRGDGVTTANGEELRFGAGRMANFHKTLPHDLVGRVHAASYHAMVAALTIGDGGALETLPIGANRSNGGAFDDTNPEQFAR